MQTCRKKITKEQYDRAMAERGAIVSEDEAAVFTASELLGYGLYGSRVYTQNGEYFVEYTLGSTCD